MSHRHVRPDGTSETHLDTDRTDAQRLRRIGERRPGRGWRGNVAERMAAELARQSTTDSRPVDNDHGDDAA